jgi:hypothetical protein
MKKIKSERFAAQSNETRCSHPACGGSDQRRLSVKGLDGPQGRGYNDPMKN